MRFGKLGTRKLFTELYLQVWACGVLGKGKVKSEGSEQTSKQISQINSGTKEDGRPAERTYANIPLGSTGLEYERRTRPHEDLEYCEGRMC